MIADVAFDVPVPHPFSYRVPDGWPVAPGQRVIAALRGGARVGMLVALREGDVRGLKDLLAVADAAPIVQAGHLDLLRWIAAESLSSLGSTCAALLPPPPPPDAPPASPTLGTSRAAAAGDTTLLVGAGRERRALLRVAAARAGALVVVPDVDAAGRWAQRLAQIDTVARLDSGVSDGERRRGWTRLVRGEARLAVGTRSALLAPLPPRALVVLVDEHEAAHKPPGPPRLHSREIVVERAARDDLDVALTAATPSVETWWRADSERVRLDEAAPGPWPAVVLADTRGILRREPLTPPLSRAIRETLAARRRVFLLVTRLSSTLACDECGTVVRCPACALALAYSRAAARLVCRLCGRDTPLPDTCSTCSGRRVSPFGWGAERVEHAVRRRFPDARVARWDPEAARGARAEAQRAAAARADVVIGTRAALRLFGPASLGLAGFVSPDQLLRLPDFRAGERLFAALWAAAERVEPRGTVVVQTQNPAHYAFDALVHQDLARFYRPETRFRAELGYPPFRRLAVVTVTASAGADPAPLAERLHAALRGVAGLAVYPPLADRRGRARRLVVKGGADLPRVLAPALAEADARGPETRGIMDVEVDPVEWRF